MFEKNNNNITENDLRHEEWEPKVEIEMQDKRNYKNMQYFKAQWTIKWHIKHFDAIYIHIKKKKHQ